METSAQDSEVFGDLQTSYSSVRLVGRIGAGQLTINAQEFVQGTDRTFIAQAELGSRKIYRSVFSHNNDSVVFVRIRDDEHTITLALSDSEDPSIGRLSVWKDSEAPKSFAIDVPRFLRTSNAKESILENKGDELDQVGNRRPPDITAQELFQVFGEDPAYKKFMRGEQPQIALPPKDGLRGTNWKCAWICLIPACGIVCLFCITSKPKPPSQP
jgi:hypothetical protein